MGTIAFISRHFIESVEPNDGIAVPPVLQEFISLQPIEDHTGKHAVLGE